MNQKKSFSRGKQAGTLTNRVVDAIESQVASGDLKPGNYVISEREMCKRLGVSRVTVRRGLEVLVEDGLLHREPGKGYLYRGENYSSKTLGSAVIFMHEAAEEELSSDLSLSLIWSGARLEAKEHGLVTMIQPSVGGTITRDYAHKLASVSKAIITDIVDLQSFEFLTEAGIAVVGINYLVDLPIDNVVADNYGGSRKAVHYLYSLGCRKIGFLSTYEALKPVNRDYHIKTRLSGYWGSLYSLGHLPKNNWVKEVGYGANINIKAIKDLLKDSIDGLVIPDETLYPIVKELMIEAGRADLKIVAWGEQTSPISNEIGLPPFIRFDEMAMGREGVRRLLFRVQNPDAITMILEIPSRLILPNA